MISLEKENNKLKEENDRLHARFVTIVTPGKVFGSTSRDVYFHDRQEGFLNALEYTKGKWGNFSIWNDGGHGNSKFKNGLENAKKIYLQRFNDTPENQRYEIAQELADAYFDKFIAPHSTQR